MTKKKDISTFITAYQKFGILVILIAELIIFAILSDKFFATNNLMLVGRQISFFGMSAVGMTMVLLLGEIDISGFNSGLFRLSGSKAYGRGGNQSFHCLCDCGGHFFDIWFPYRYFCNPV